MTNPSGIRYLVSKNFVSFPEIFTFALRIVKELKYGEEKQRSADPGHPRVHRAKSKRCARNIQVHHHEEQEKYTGTVRDQEIQPVSEKSHCSQRN